MEQLELAYLYVRDGVKRVPDEIVETWETTTDAIQWSMDNCVGKAGKPKSWFAKHLGRHRQTMTKIYHGINKLDPAEVTTFDLLTGWSAVEQFVEKHNQRIKDAQTKAIQQLIMNGLTARSAA